MSEDLEQRLRAASITERNRAIRDAHAAGYSLRTIATIVEMSHTGVRKIIQENPA